MSEPLVISQPLTV